MNTLRQGINDILEMVFPSVCLACDKRLISQEKHLCFDCWHDLPVTNFHFRSDNKVAQLFWGRVEIENAASYFSIKKGSNYQHLIHFIKYKNRKDLGYETGKRFGFELIKSEDYNCIDVVVPVPLHPTKEKQRGYNQCDYIAQGVGEAMKKRVISDNLYRKKYTATQTRKNRYERWQNVEGIFGIRRPEEFERKHILLVDDVVTTGSTLEACAIQLLKLQETKVSIATLAFADI